MTKSTKTTTKPITKIRRTTPAPFAGISCMMGHTYRVVLEKNQPIALECVNCATTWKTERVEIVSGLVEFLRARKEWRP